jgi:hypothetical protein
MHLSRVAIHRWGWLIAALIAVTAVLELRRGERDPDPEARAAWAPAPAYAILDHAPLRRVTVGDYHSSATPERPPTLTVRSERPYYFGHTLGGLPTVPSWVEPRHGDHPVTTFHGELDGSWIAVADTVVFLIDLEHHVELGLDFEWFHMSPPRFDSGRAFIIEAHRAGPRVIVSGSDPEGGPFLASVDIATGRSAWVVQFGGDTVPGFAVTRGHVVTSEFSRDRPELVVREAGSGHVVATVPTKEGTYTLETRADGSLHGIIEALAADGYTSEIDVTVE